jgi:hypothetical protein
MGALETGLADYTAALADHTAVAVDGVDADNAWIQVNKAG